MSEPSSVEGEAVQIAEVQPVVSENVGENKQAEQHQEVVAKKSVETSVENILFALIKEKLKDPRIKSTWDMIAFAMETVEINKKQYNIQDKKQVCVKLLHIICEQLVDNAELQSSLKQLIEQGDSLLQTIDCLISVSKGIYTFQLKNKRKFCCF